MVGGIALLLFAETVASLSQSGATAMREQRFADAEKSYRELRRREPSNPMWRMNLGVVLHSAGRYAEAIPELEAFVKAKAEPSPAYLLIGLSHLKQGQFCQAVAPLTVARQWNAQRTILDLADAHRGCGEHEFAARAYEAAVTFVTSDKRTLIRQAAHEYWLARNYADAKRLLQSIASHYAEDPEFNYEYGDTLVRTDGPEHGLKYLLQSATAAPDRYAARAEAGKALLSVGRVQEAIPHLEAGSRADATVLLPLSRAYKAVGRTEDAKRVEAEYRSKL
jgi:predicted Zn-dependent protease